MNKLALLFLLTLAGTARSDARDPVTLLSGSGFDGTPDLTSEGDLSAVLRNTSTTEFALQLSDGRGLTWSAPLEVDPVGSSDEIQFRKAAIVGDEVFVIFADDRFDQQLFGGTSSSTTFLRVYDHTTGTLGPELQVPTGVAPENLVVTSFDFLAREVGGTVHLHLAMAVRERVPGLPITITERVVLYSSQDGGATWLAPLLVGPATHGPFEEVRVLADGGQVSVVFHGELIPGPFGSPYLYLFHQRSLDAGLSTDFTDPVPVPLVDYLSVWDVDLRGSLMAVAFQRYHPTNEAFALTSQDGGATFPSAVQVVDPVAGSGTSVGAPQVAIVGTSGDVCVVAHGIGSVGHMLVSYHSANGGLTWPDQERAILGVGAYPRLVASRGGRGRVVVTCRPPFDFGSPVAEIHALVSLDKGKSFGPGMIVMEEGLSHLSSLAWNDLYQNALVGYGDYQRQVVGGFRPQAVSPQGFLAGSTSLSADFIGFDGGADLGWLLLSTDTTSLPLPLGDGRELGIGVTSLLVDTLLLALTGPFGTGLSPAGQGTMGQVPLAPPGVPAGLTLHAVGLGFDVQTGTFVDISDVVRIDT